MESSVSANNYVNSNQLSYGTHYVTLASDSISFASNTGKFILNYITPNLSTSSSYDTKLPKNSGRNVINNKNNDLGISNITSSNYVELTVPKHLFYVTGVKHPDIGTEPEVQRVTYTKGQKFLVVHMDNEFTTPYIIGVM